MKKKFLVGIFFLAIGIFAFTFYLGFNNSNPVTGNTVMDNPSKNYSATSGTTSGTPISSSGISQTDLAKHDSQSDCWIAYKGKVYDITSFLPKHGGRVNRILPYCGTASEFEQAFTRQHGTSKASTLMRVGVFMGDFSAQGNLK